MHKQPTDDIPLQLELLLGDSVALILKHEDPDLFFDWLGKHLHEYYMGEDPGQLTDTQGFSMMAIGLGRAIWNAMPLPGNNFRPRPLPEPGRNVLCPCGSGKKYKLCCAGGPPFPAFGPRLLWPLVLERLPRASQQDVIGRGWVPIEALFELAHAYQEQQHPKKGVSLLEPLFAGPVRKPDEAHDYAMNLLCDLYDDQGHYKKKAALLQQIIDTTGRSPLRSGAWQRKAAIHMDSYDIPGAWAAFREALQDDPDSLSIGVLEVQLLMAEDRLSEAQLRAKFWIRRLHRAGLVNDEGPLQFLSAIARDPVEAMKDLGLQMEGGAGEELGEWLQQVAGRPVAEYRATQDWVEDADEVEMEQNDSLETLFLLPPPAIEELEARWRLVFPLDKPFSVHDEPFGGENPWGTEYEQEWMAFLNDHPEAFDSLDIIDDLVTALIQHGQYDTAWLDEDLVKPLLLRAAGIIDHALSSIAAPRIVWGFVENRPALRSLARLVNFYLRSGDAENAMVWAQRLLALNPDDNHGLRSIVVNQLLFDGDDAGVLDIAESYPDDSQAEIPYGKVLVLYRLQRLEEAHEALHAAMECLPKIPRYLTAKRVRTPKLDPIGVRYGGDDQAWLYRNAIRDLWLETPGAIDWLKQAVKTE